MITRFRQPAATHMYGSALLGSLLWGCGAPALEPVTREEAPLPPRQSATFRLRGADGPLVANAPDLVVNRYAALVEDAAAGGRALRVRGAASLGLSAGDLLLIIQMQGAAMDTSDSPRYGALTALGGAGLFEFAVVGAVSGDIVQVDGRCGGLRNSYRVAGRAQVVRVPQYRSLQVPRGTSLSAAAWDGEVGGVLALDVVEAATVDGALDVTGRGFRGGAVDPSSSIDATAAVTLYRSADPRSGAEKGESVAGSAQDYDRLGGRFGRGAPANGGGGGNAHNAAGGGGALGDNGKPWTGQGVMDPGAIGARAWQLDPAVVRGALADSSGGGRGGYSYSLSRGPLTPDPLTAGPGSAAWGGNRRREVGGLGGRPLAEPADRAPRAFLGGGGGAGDGNNGAASPGGSGGGVLMVLGAPLQGSGRLAADGMAAAPTSDGSDDAPGGGGGGGTILLEQGARGVALSARGGKGGDQTLNQVLLTDLEAEGPGGGGGGGVIRARGSDVASTTAGGPGGLSASPFVSSFPANGATQGASGPALQALADLPGCFGAQPAPGSSADLALRLTAEPNPAPVQGGLVRYTARVVNSGPDSAAEVALTLDLPEGSTVLESQLGAGWSCAQEALRLTCKRDSALPGSAPEVAVLVSLPPGEGAVRAVGEVRAAATADPQEDNNRVSHVLARVNLSISGGGVSCSVAPSASRSSSGLGGAPWGLAGLGTVLWLGRGRRRKT